MEHGQHLQRFGGPFTNTGSTQLGKATAIEALKGSKADPGQVDQVIYGNVTHTQKRIV